jgi:hypothetical protein
MHGCSRGITLKSCTRIEDLQQSQPNSPDHRRPNSLDQPRKHHDPIRWSQHQHDLSAYEYEAAEDERRLAKSVVFGYVGYDWGHCD